MKAAICLFGMVLLSLQVASQTFYSSNGSTLFVSEQATMHVSGGTIVRGKLKNEGQLSFSGSVNFSSNDTIGNVRLSGENDYAVIGKNLICDQLEIDKTGRAILVTDSIIVREQLTLSNGVLALSGRLVIDAEKMGEGSSRAYVEGPMWVNTPDMYNLTFPVGLGNSYLPLTLHNVSEGRIMISAIEPEPDDMVPGDSLIGISDEAAWMVGYYGDKELNSRVSVFHRNMDLNDFPVTKVIRANKYIPTIAQLQSNYTFKTLLAAEGSSEKINIPGKLISEESIRLMNDVTMLAVGVSPTTDKLHFYVPTVFTPNGSYEENRVFRPFLTGTYVFKSLITIYDAFNNLIYRQERKHEDLANTGWSGMYNNGSEAPEGVYYYQVKVFSTSGTFEKTGTVLLVR